IDADKNSIAFVGTDSQNFRLAGNMVRSGGAFSSSDLAGKWSILTFDDLPSSNNPGWNNLKVTVDSSGTVIAGTLVDSDGLSTTVAAGSLSITAGGVLSGSITAGAVTLLFPRERWILVKPAQLLSVSIAKTFASSEPR